MKNKTLTLVVKPSVDEMRIRSRWNIITAATCRMVAIKPISVSRGSISVLLQRFPTIEKQTRNAKARERPTVRAAAALLDATDTAARTQAQVKAEETLLSDQGKL